MLCSLLHNYSCSNFVNFKRYNRTHKGCKLGISGKIVIAMYTSYRAESQNIQSYGIHLFTSKLYTEKIVSSILQLPIEKFICSQCMSLRGEFKS